MELRGRARSDVTAAGPPGILTPGGGFRQLAVAAAAATGSEQRKKTGKKHPGKAILAGESCGLGS